MSRYFKLLVSSTAFATVVFGGILIIASRGNAAVDDTESKIQQGFFIAPVPLNMVGKNPAWVGLGSYLVNAGGACNDCHTNPPFTDKHDPFLGQPKQVNAAAYLGGGTQFIPAHPPNFPAIVSRNLTPDKTG